MTGDEFIHFKNTIQELLWHYEFYQFDVDSNDCINGHDFALSLITNFPLKDFQNYVQHLDAEEHQGFTHDRVSLNEFIGFQYLLK